jgi:hypothetical protein
VLTVAAGLTNVPDAAALCEIARKAVVPIDRTRGAAVGAAMPI